MVLKSTLALLVIAFIVIQFFRIYKSVPEVSPTISFLQMEQPPADIHQLFVTACYDCHSYEATYPWYSNIAPVSWFLQSHIVEGREHLNFSTWGNYSIKEQKELLEEAAEEIQEGKMPLKSYTIIHKDAKFTAEERTKILGWLNLQSNLGGKDTQKVENPKKEKELDND